MSDLQSINNLFIEKYPQWKIEFIKTIKDQIIYKNRFIYQISNFEGLILTFIRTIQHNDLESIAIEKQENNTYKTIYDYFQKNNNDPLIFDIDKNNIANSYLSNNLITIDRPIVVPIEYLEMFKFIIENYN